MRPQDRLSGQAFDVPGFVRPDGRVVRYGDSISLSQAEIDRANRSETELPFPDPMAQLSDHDKKTADRWAAQCGPVPVPELLAVVREMGLDPDTTPLQEIDARRAMVLWINKNVLRMKRDLKNAAQVAP